MSPTSAALDFKFLQKWTREDWKYLQEQVAGVYEGKCLLLRVPRKLKTVGGASVLTIIFKYNSDNGLAGVRLQEPCMASGMPSDIHHWLEGKEQIFSSWRDLSIWVDTVAAMLDG